VTTLYRAFGLTIVSELPLPELERAESGPADIEIARRPIARPHATGVRSFYEYGEEDQYLYWPQVGGFLIRGVSAIDIAPEAGASEGLLRLPLLGPVMALLLHLRGVLVLHASAIRFGAHVAAFVGDKGAGKSTIAAAALARGGQWMTDDLLAVSFDDPRGPRAMPGYPSLKLMANCADRFALAGAHDLAAPIENFPKHIRRLSAPGRDAATIDGLYLLRRGGGARVTALARPAALNVIMRYAYVPLFEGKPWPRAETQRHFSQCAGLADAVRVATLDTPDDLDRLGEAIAAVENDLAAAPAGAP
jgi:hypothetical protein